MNKDDITATLADARSSDGDAALWAIAQQLCRIADAIESGEAAKAGAFAIMNAPLAPAKVTYRPEAPTDAPAS